MKNLFLFLSVILFTSSLFAQSYKPEYNYSYGESYKYKSNMKGFIVQEVMQQEYKITTDGEMFVKLSVDKPVKNNLVLYTSLDSGEVHTSTPMVDTTISLDMIKDVRTKIVIEPNGKVISKELIDTLGGDLQKLGINQNDIFQFFILPGKKVKQGDTWEGNKIDSVKAMGGVIVNTSNVTYKLAGEENINDVKVLRIEFKGRTTSEGSTSMMGQDLTIDGKGRLNGVLFFNHDKGIVHSSTTEMDNNMTLTTAGSSNMIIPMTQSITVELSLLK